MRNERRRSEVLEELDLDLDLWLEGDPTAEELPSVVSSSLLGTAGFETDGCVYTFGCVYTYDTDGCLHNLGA